MPQFRLEREIVTLTNAQIKALPTTGITLVAAPGAGFRIKVLGATLRIDTAAGVYTNINTTYATLQIQTAPGSWLVGTLANDNTTTPALAALTTALNTAHDALVDLLHVSAVTRLGTADQWVMPFASTFINQAADIENEVVEIKMDNNGSGDLTGGHASNSLDVTLTYLVEPI